MPKRGPGDHPLTAIVQVIAKDESVPAKVRDLVAELEQAGFVNRGGKGNHRNFVHPKVARPVTISGNPGDDAQHYQTRAVKRAIEESEK
jgi:predicted RNA binding protein YcfA (HicA-like mRNA interferase family)